MVFAVRGHTGQEGPHTAQQKIVLCISCSLQGLLRPSPGEHIPYMLLCTAAAAGSLERLPLDPNPFKGVDFLRSPKFTEGVQRSVQAAGGLKDETGRLLARAARIPTAVWLDKVSELSRMVEALQMATEQQERTGRPVLCTFVVYNLPGRDCSAKASNGEISATDGLPAYESRYLQPMLSILRQFPAPRKVFFVEPDSLPNLVTNQHVPKCAAVAQAYKEGIVRAVEVLAPHGTIYLDVGWSGWIGSWSSHQMAQLLDTVMTRMPADAVSAVRGIVTDVSNYGTVYAEEAYARTMLHELAQLGRPDLHAVIDTGRDAKDMGGQWCNANGAGAGHFPSFETGKDSIDAYFWIKPPGESDGISDPNSLRYDPECGKAGAMRGAPDAGEWFHKQFLMLIQNAKPALDQAPSYEPVMATRPAPATATASSSAHEDAAKGPGEWVDGDFAFSYDDEHGTSSTPAATAPGGAADAPSRPLAAGNNGGLPSAAQHGKRHRPPPPTPPLQGTGSTPLAPPKPSAHASTINQVLVLVAMALAAVCIIPLLRRASAVNPPERARRAPRKRSRLSPVQEEEAIEILHCCFEDGSQKRPGSRRSGSSGGSGGTRKPGKTVRSPKTARGERGAQTSKSKSEPRGLRTKPCASSDGTPVD